MAGTLGPNGLTTYGYSVGDSGWGAATNTSLQNMDALVQLGVVSAQPSTTPPTPASGDEGKRYLVPSGATGAWSGKANYIAQINSSLSWNFYAPITNAFWSFVDKATGIIWYWNGTTWGPITGQYLGRTVKTSGTTFTTNVATRILVVTAWGGGGGSGGSAGGSGYASGTGGGAAGAKCMKVYSVSGSTGYTYAIGAAGAAGSAGNNDGGDGGDTTFTDGSTLITAKGGKGGKGTAGTNTGYDFALGGNGQLSTNGDINGSGALGCNGEANVFNVKQCHGGNGGSSDWGSGGRGGTTSSAGDSIAGGAGAGYASGGGGRAIYDNASSGAGSAGTQGIIIFDEYT